MSYHNSTKKKKKTLIYHLFNYKCVIWYDGMPETAYACTISWRLYASHMNYKYYIIINLIPIHINTYTFCVLELWKSQNRYNNIILFETTV